MKREEEEENAERPTSNAQWEKWRRETIALVMALGLMLCAGTGWGQSPNVNVVNPPSRPVPVSGNSAVISPTVTVSTSPAYTAGDVVGGKITLTGAMRISGGTGILQSMLIIDKSNQKAAVEVLIFDSDPSAGTYTDNGAFTFNATDGAKLIRRIPIAAGDYTTVGTVAVADVSPGGRVLKASGTANLYAVIVTSGTPTYAATGDFILRVGILQD